MMSFYKKKTKDSPRNRNLSKDSHDSIENFSFAHLGIGGKGKNKRN